MDKNKEGTQPTVPPEVDSKLKDVVNKSEVATSEHKPDIPQSNAPVKKEGEDETAFALRTQLWVAQEARNNSKTAEDKTFYQTELDRIRGELAKPKEKKPEPTKSSEPEGDDDEEKKIVETIKKYGFVMKEDLNTQLQETTKQFQVQKSYDAHNRAIDEFYAKRPELRQTVDLGNGTKVSGKEIVEEYILNNYRVDENTPPSKLREWLEITSDRFFPKSTAKSDAAKASQAKVDATNIGQQSAQEVSKAQKDEQIAVLRKAGWTDEDLRRNELI